MSGNGESLRETFHRAQQLHTSILDDVPKPTPDDFRQLMSLWTTCAVMIRQLALFSPNESISDVSTDSIPLFMVDAMIADVFNHQNVGSGVEERLRMVEKAVMYYDRFLSLCESYELYTPESNKEPRDAVEIRQDKINKFKRRKELESKIKMLKEKINTNEDDDSECERELAISTVQLCIQQVLDNKNMLGQEKAMLQMRMENERTQPPKEGRSERKQQEDDEMRLDMPHPWQRGPLLSKEGKPLRPFVITNKRQEMMKGVFRPGHNLPTMTVDEYLEKEYERGNIIPASDKNAPAVDKEAELDENEEAHDRETMRLREWDEFTDANPRGQGNRMNRG